MSKKVLMKISNKFTEYETNTVEKGRSNDFHLSQHQLFGSIKTDRFPAPFNYKRTEQGYDKLRLYSKLDNINNDSKVLIKSEYIMRFFDGKSFPD